MVQRTYKVRKEGDLICSKLYVFLGNKSILWTSKTGCPGNLVSSQDHICCQIWGLFWIQISYSYLPTHTSPLLLGLSYLHQSKNKQSEFDLVSFSTHFALLWINKVNSQALLTIIHMDPAIVARSYHRPAKYRLPGRHGHSKIKNKISQKIEFHVNMHEHACTHTYNLHACTPIYNENSCSLVPFQKNINYRMVQMA